MKLQNKISSADLKAVTTTTTAICTGNNAQYIVVFLLHFFEGHWGLFPSSSEENNLEENL